MIIFLLGLAAFYTAGLSLLYVATCVQAVRWRRQRDQLTHFLQRKGWLAAFEAERTTIFRDPERRH